MMKPGAGRRSRVEPAAQVAVVELRLLPRRGIVAQHRGALGGGLLGELGAHVAAQAGDAHREAMLVAQALVDGGQRGRRQVLLDVVAEGGDLAVHQRNVPVDRFSSGNQARTLDAHSAWEKAAPPGTRPAAAARPTYLRTVLRSRPRARAIWETLSPACQCLSSFTTSTTANILLAIRAPSIRHADGEHHIRANLNDPRWGIA